MAAMGVTFSIAMFVALLGFMNGLNVLLDGIVLNRTPHVRIFKEVKPNPRQPVMVSEAYKNSHNFISSLRSGSGRSDVYANVALMRAIRSDPRVVGVAPKLTAPVLYNSGTIDITGSVSGIDVTEESRLFSFESYVTEGAANGLRNASNSIVLGKGLADKLLADIGDVVLVTTSSGEQMPLKVVGYFQSGILEFDKIQSYASIATVQKLLGKAGDYITDLQVKLRDIKTAPDVAREYRRLYSVDAEDIQTANAQFETGSFVRTLISYVVGITLLIVAGFGIYNILNMLIYEKMDSIAIMKATGFSGKDVKRIFIGIALSIGIFGGLLGLVTGLVFSLIIDQIPFSSSALPGVKTYPVTYSAYIYIIGFLFAIVSTYLAGFFPSRKASKIDPVIIIRGK